jgi:hypothetical protein
MKVQTGRKSVVCNVTNGGPGSGPHPGGGSDPSDSEIHKPQGNKPLLVDDGSHRIHAAQLEGATHIKVHVKGQGLSAVGNHTGMKEAYVKVSDLHPSAQLKNQSEADKKSYDPKAIAKYRKQYKEKGEAGWHELPLVQDPNMKGK